MAFQSLPLLGGINQSGDQTGLDALGADSKDVYIDPLGNIVRRPGLTEFCNLGTGLAVDGLVWVPAWDSLLAVSGGRVFRVTDQVGSFSEVSGDALDVGIRPTFAYHPNGSVVIAANGGQMVKVPSSGDMAYIADASAPTSVTHVAFLDLFILANDSGTDDFYWSQVNDPLSWDSEWASAEGDPDNVTALNVADREVLLSGTNSHEVWFNDGQTFSRKDTAHIQQGTIAPYSVTFVDGVYYTLNGDRELVRLTGRVPEVVSTPINQIIQSLGIVADCRADTLKLGGRSLVVFNFVSDERTFVYDPGFGFWYEWGFWDTGEASYKRSRINCVEHAPAWGFTLVGDRASGKIYKLDTTAYTDDSTPIRALRRTGHLSWGTMREKRSNGLMIRLKRTTPVLSGKPTVSVRWQDNGDGQWIDYETIPLSQAGNTDFVGYLPGPLGMYYTRQYEFVSANEDTEFILSEVQEDVTVLGR